MTGAPAGMTAPGRGLCASRRLFARIVTAAMLAGGLAACGTISDETASRVFTSPGQFTLYTCQDLDARSKTTRDRQVQLEQLMDRASQGPGGKIVNAVAYRTEYLQTRGELEELAKAANEKKCATESKYSSGRALF